MKNNRPEKCLLPLRRLLPNNFLVDVAILAGFFACVNASALMVPLTTTSLVDRASCIVEGRVTNLSSRWTDDHSAIVTEVVIEAADVLLGETNRVTFLYQGGVVGDLELRVSDMPVVTNGQQVLVFLRAQTPEETRRDRPDATRGRLYRLVGAAQGLYRIEGSRASKAGFSIVGDPAVIDRNTETAAIKALIRERLGATKRQGGSR